jgi:hypothetical protein
VSQVSGEVWIDGPASGHVAATRGMELQPGATVATTKRGRVSLSNGLQSMVVGPATVVTIPAPEEGSQTILQRAGTVGYTVDRRDEQHFRVTTPYLAAVVKGTSFDVAIMNESAAVSVSSGMVAVKALSTGDMVDVAAGQSASVSATAGLDGSKAGTVVKGEPEGVTAGLLKPEEGVSAIIASEGSIATEPSLFDRLLGRDSWMKNPAVMGFLLLGALLALGYAYLRARIL